MLNRGLQEHPANKIRHSRTSEKLLENSRHFLSSHPRAGYLPVPPSFLSSAQPARPRDVNTRFGRKLRALRREHRWTQLQMADILGINRSYISEIERGRKSVSLGMLEVIALGFEMSLAELLRDI